MDHFSWRFQRRFWEKVDTSNATLFSCWNWRGGPIEGYGQIRLDYPGGLVRSHRVAYELFISPILPGKLVCHHCDNPRCVNPCHLFLGTIQDNMNDRNQKGRTAHLLGELNGEAKLNASQVLEIRHKYAQGNITYRVLAQKYGLSFGHIGDIVKRKAWRHL